MTYVVLSMVAIVAVAATVVVYVAYPHRGREIPLAPWLGRAARRARSRVSVVERDGDRDHDVHLAASLSGDRAA
ncbi:hypothetical protein [Nocardioides sp. zg-DK7169]|uniref:hypothetical protein n=1 Tax=Nocardioides sp. zg-DK7169 TaxID=2736600 RepID=UPI001555E291|nr:hypothetical protein [Nocardioides sp. zg-DK7169]NPC95567.1 hypothetical protein [Nocardioides sp. zg-DK7169]